MKSLVIVQKDQNHSSSPEQCPMIEINRDLICVYKLYQQIYYQGWLFGKRETIILQRRGIE